jgi:hypothetical protein
MRNAVLLQEKNPRDEHNDSQDLRVLVQRYMSAAYPFTYEQSASKGDRPNQKQKHPYAGLHDPELGPAVRADDTSSTS